MTNQQFEYIQQIAREKNIDLSKCPTCRAKRDEVAPGVWIWSESTYTLHGTTHSCDCEFQTRLQRHYLLANIPEDYWTLGVDDWFGDPNSLGAVIDYLSHWDDNKWHGRGIELYSPTLGVGKTMLAMIIAKAAIRRHESVYCTTMRDVISVPHDAPYDIREMRLRRLRNSSVLVLDEVGKGMASEAQANFYATELEDLVRFRTGGKGITILTTNLTPKELDCEYPRIYSLLAAKQRQVLVTGTDARKSGALHLINDELDANGEARPLN